MLWIGSLCLVLKILSVNLILQKRGQKFYIEWWHLLVPVAPAPFSTAISIACSYLFGWIESMWNLLPWRLRLLVLHVVFIVLQPKTQKMKMWAILTRPADANVRLWFAAVFKQRGLPSRCCKATSADRRHSGYRLLFGIVKPKESTISFNYVFLSHLQKASMEEMKPWKPIYLSNIPSNWSLVDYIQISGFYSRLHCVQICRCCESFNKSVTEWPSVKNLTSWIPKVSLSGLSRWPHDVGWILRAAEELTLEADGRSCMSAHEQKSTAEVKNTISTTPQWCASWGWSCTNTESKQQYAQATMNATVWAALIVYLLLLWLNQTTTQQKWVKGLGGELCIVWLSGASHSKVQKTSNRQILPA